MFKLRIVCFIPNGTCRNLTSYIPAIKSFCETEQDLCFFPLQITALYLAPALGIIELKI